MGDSEEVNATGKGKQSDSTKVFHGLIIKLSITAIS